MDLYNAVSLRHVVPIGGEDLAAVDGDVALRFAGQGEPAVRLLGEAPPELARPKPGEVIYADRAGALCRRWNWKEADRTKLTEATTAGFLVVEALPPVDRPLLDTALADLAALIAAHCGGTTRTAILDRAAPATEFEDGSLGPLAFVVVQPGVIEHLLFHEDAQGVLQLHVLDEQVVLGLQVRAPYMGDLK